MDSTAVVEDQVVQAAPAAPVAPLAAPAGQPGPLESDVLVEDVSIDGMCGVY